MRGPVWYILYRFGKPLSLLIAAPGMSKQDVLAELSESPHGVTMRIKQPSFERSTHEGRD